ncbi:probable basic-leucine zipper transcription factor N isoform X14 [Drosophila subpulchrella]|uniref:probable basic-leucine zipper transcription factor N isoform X14 n=1 Tax=Drosophila subpulchrella TaxID=1486046 RepID=UPI0018A17EC9|nr:probable basic-leucine zipper transcription factor N isoform X14 [Drosophila subpulchrella]
MQPSSLSLAERLAFFSNLCESGGGGGGGSASGRYRSRTSSYSRSPPVDRTTPRSSTTASSASVTPTPMDYSPIPHEKEPSSLTLESIIEPEQEEMREQVDQQQEGVKLGKNEPPVLRESPLHNGFHVLTRSATDPPASTSPLRLNVRTIGKLILPDTFRGDRNNNNNNITIGNKSGNTSWNSCMVKLQSLDPVNLTVQLRTIGKVKSPFIEKQQEKVNPEKLSNGTSDSGSDSGKENCASNQQENQQPPQQLQQQQQHQQDEDRAPPRVSEMRRKITRLVQQQQPPPQPVNRRHTTEITTVTIRSPNVDDRFAKYFGVKESFNSTTTLLKTQSLPPTTNQVEATNSHVRLPTTTVVSKRRELLKRTRPLSMDHYSSGCTSPTAMPSPKRAHSPINRRKATISSIEDIEVTPDELRAAGKDFKLLYGELLG